MSEGPLLSVQNLHKYFGGIIAVDGFNLTVERNSISGLIGPNGAGKTTVFRTISGFHDPDKGEIIFDGDKITGSPIHEVVD